MTPSSIDRLFLITGTTRGLGAALAEAACGLAGSLVISLSRAPSFTDGNHRNICVDLNDITAIGPALSRIRLDPQQTGHLTQTALINNAGVLDPIGPIGDCDDTELAENIRVNLIAPMILTRHFFHFSKALPGRKWIVNITSGAARAPYSGWAAYGAAKAGLDMATAAMALDFSRVDPSFVVCAVAPGTVDTAMQAKIRRCPSDRFARVEKFLSLKANGGLEAPEKAAARLLRLIQDDRLGNGGRYDLREMDG